MEPLAKPVRRQLENAVVAARDTAEEAAGAALMHLTDEERALRRRLRAHGRELGDTFLPSPPGRGAGGEGAGVPLFRSRNKRQPFAVRRVTLLVAKGVNMDQAMLALSTYMGHAKISNTYWYLTAVPELMAAAADKLEQSAPGLEVEDA
jgi:hypothetical protein